MLPIKYDARSVQQELNNLSEQLRTLIKVVNTDEVQTNLINCKEQGNINGKQQLVLNAGESASVAGTQEDEYVYINAEHGLQVNSTTDNWNSGWAGRKTAILKGDNLSVQGGATFDGGTSTTVTVLCDDAGQAALNLMGGSQGQGTGRLYVGQSPEYGGGIEYNGDSDPVSTGAEDDYTNLFRRNNSTDYWTARNRYNNNNWEFRGTVTENASDERLKENITPIENALEKVEQLRGVEFDWKDDVEEKGFIPYAKHETGVIAQDVQKVIPDAAVPAPFDENYLTVKHEKIIPLLIEAIKELKAEVEELKANQ